MSVFPTPEAHAANPPESWTVTRISDRVWYLCAADGVMLDRFKSRDAAVEAKTSGWLFHLYHKEARWYAGENIPNWRPYAEAVGSR